MSDMKEFADQMQRMADEHWESVINICIEQATDTDGVVNGDQLKSWLLYAIEQRKGASTATSNVVSIEENHA